MIITDDQLKSILAKMLPETVHFSHSGELCWSHNYSQDSHLFVRVLDTELLHLCSLVEAGLDWKQLLEYDRKLEQKCWYEDGESNDGRLSLIRATWQQRTRALAEVKGVTP